MTRNAEEVYDRFRSNTGLERR